MKLTWSNFAKRELQELRRYSIKRWRGDVAYRYLQDIAHAAKQLSMDPCRARPLRGNFHILRVRSHILSCIL